MQIQLNQPVFCRQTLLGVLAFGAWMASQLQAAPATGRFIDKVFRDDSGEHKYVVFVPAAYRADTPSPAIVFLHGAGEQGNENRMPLTVGLAPFVQARAQTFPFIVIFPQCETTDGRILESWQSNSADGRRVLAILEAAEKDYRIDERRVVLTGWFPDWASGLRLENLSIYVMQVFNTAGNRAIMIGIALGVAATGLRILFGIDRSWLGGGDA